MLGKLYLVVAVWPMRVRAALGLVIQLHQNQH